MRFTTTILLLLLNLATFGLIFLLQDDQTISSRDSKGLSSQISRQIIEANRIEISGPGLKTPRTLTRDGSDWTLESPNKWSANYFAVNRILNQLQFLEEQVAFSVDEIKSTGQSLDDYGLEDPSILLRITGANRSIELKIGSKTEIGSNVYILGPRGKYVHVVSNELISSLLVGLDELRNRKVFDIPVFEVEALGVQHVNPDNPSEKAFKVLLRRNNDGWRFESPLSAEADAALVSDTISSLALIKIDRFIPDTGDPLRRGLNSPFMKITLYGNKRQQTLLIGNPYQPSEEPEYYYAKIENYPTVFTVSAEPFDQLRVAQQSLRERKFIDFQNKPVSAINIRSEEMEIRLRKLETSGWQVIKSNRENEVTPHRASPAVLQKLIADIQTLRAVQFAYDSPTTADLSRLGFDKPTRTLQIEFQEDAPEIILQLAHPEENEEKLYAKTNQSEYIYEINRFTSLSCFPLNPLYYRNRLLEILPQAALIESIEIIDQDSGESIIQLISGNEDSSWEPLLEKQPLERKNAILTLLDWVREARVESHLADQFPEVYSTEDGDTVPWAYQLNVEIILPGGDRTNKETHTYYFTERLSGTSQPGASVRHKSLFNSPIQLIEALAAIVPDEPAPPEVDGQPVPDSIPLAPLPRPENSPTK